MSAIVETGASMSAAVAMSGTERRGMSGTGGIVIGGTLIGACMC